MMLANILTILVFVGAAFVSTFGTGTWHAMALYWIVIGAYLVGLATHTLRKRGH